MRYVAIGAIVFALAISLPSSKALGAVSVEADVNVNVGGEINIGDFNDQLAPHGHWVDTANYGRAWQPNLVVTDANWRPYVDGGHWAYTDAGWYWDSSYEWGWAAFHYGRWNQDAQYRWLWTPDVTWAPAWVSWRQSDFVYGWAPLPYGSRYERGVFIGGGIDIGVESFNFVPSHSFLSVNLGSVAFDHGRRATVFNQTKIINNSYTYNDNRVINNGIPVTQVATATKKEIKPVQIADAKSPAAAGDKGGKINAFRPAIKKDGKATPEEAAADKKGADVKSNTAQGKAEADATVPAKFTEAERAADSKKKAAELKADGKAVEPSPAKVDAKKAEPKAVEPKPATVDAKKAEPKTAEPSRARENAKPVEPKATEPVKSKEDASRSEKPTDSGRDNAEAKAAAVKDDTRSNQTEKRAERNEPKTERATENRREQEAPRAAKAQEPARAEKADRPDAPKNKDEEKGRPEKGNER